MPGKYPTVSDNPLKEEAGLTKQSAVLVFYRLAGTQLKSQRNEGQTSSTVGKFLPKH